MSGKTVLYDLCPCGTTKASYDSLCGDCSRRCEICGVKLEDVRITMCDPCYQAELKARGIE